MTETDAVADRASLVPGVHRLIRAITGKEGPFTGTLVTLDDSVAVCVDVERLNEWAGWAFSEAEHVCGVLDIRRRADGHDALLPWCTQRVESFLGRRSASESPLTPGELGTLVVSLLRGVRELGADADASGEWWLTGDGRPLFVHGEGGSCRARTAALVDRMMRQQTDRATVRVLEEMISVLHQPRHPVDDDRRWEAQLFARAAPRALRLDVFAPERVSEVAPRLVAADAASSDVESARRRGSSDTGQINGRRRDERRAERRREDERRLPSLAHGVRQRLGRLRQQTLERVALRRESERVQKPRSSRRRSLLLAGSLGAVVLIVGMMWPSDGDGTPADASSSQKAAGSEPAPDETAHPDPGTTPPEVPVPPTEGTALEAVPALLDGISACIAAAAEHCPDVIAEGALAPSEGVASLGASESTATLVDDYGDVAVIRLTPIEVDGEVGQIPEQMLVLERRNDIWLVRDVYDVAHQPD